MFGRQGFPDPLHVRQIDFRNAGDAEHEPAGVVSGQFKDARHSAFGLLGRDGAADGLRILFKRRLHVHGEMYAGNAIQEFCDHVWPHAVGVDLERRPVFGHIRREFDQSRRQGRLAAADDDAVQPAAARGEKTPDVLGPDGREIFLGPGQSGVVAVGAFQVATAEKDNGGDSPRPVAQGERLKAPNDIPC